MGNQEQKGKEISSRVNENRKGERSWAIKNRREKDQL